MAADTSPPTLREYLEILIAHERDLRRVQEEAIEKARQIQFTEYARRLDVLNHAHEQAKEAARSTVPREVFDNYVRENESQLRLALTAADLKVEAALKEIETERQARIRLEGSAASTRWIVTWLGLPGVLAILIGLYNAFAP